MLGHTMFNVGRCFNTDQNGILRPTGGKLGLDNDIQKLWKMGKGDTNEMANASFKNENSDASRWQLPCRVNLIYGANMGYERIGA